MSPFNQLANRLAQAIRDGLPVTDYQIAELGALRRDATSEQIMAAMRRALRERDQPQTEDTHAR